MTKNHNSNPTDGDTTSPSLVSAMLASSDKERFDKAWSRFMESYAPWIFRFCVKSGLSEHDAEEITADIVASIFQGRKTYDVSKGGFRTWLFTITRNALKKFWKSSQRFQFIDGIPLDKVVSPKALEAELFERYDREIAAVAREEVKATVKDRDWEIFIRLTESTAKPSDLAKELGTSRANIDQIKKRILERLTEAIRVLREKGFNVDET